MNVLKTIFSKIGYVKAPPGRGDIVRAGLEAKKAMEIDAAKTIGQSTTLIELTKFRLANEEQRVAAQNDVGPLMRSYAMGTGSTAWASTKSYSQLVDAYKSWVYTCIDKISKAVAMIPLGLYVYRDRTGRKVKNLNWVGEYKRLPPGDRPYFLKEAGMEREQIYDHPFLDLISHPNSFMTRFGLWYETMIRLELGGMCGWLIASDGLKVPRQIFPLPLTKTAVLSPKVTANMELQGWQYRDGQIEQTFAPDEILLFKYASPVSPFHAMSPLMAQTYPYDIDLFLMQQQRAFFDNMATPGLHLWTDQRLNKAQVDEMTEIVDDQFSTAVKAGKTLITHSGLRAEKLGGTAQESMIDEVARFVREKLITSYDLSEGKVGLVRDVNRANMEALDKTFVEECLRPKCMLMEEVIETFFLPRYDTGLSCDYELPDVSEKLLTLAERAQNLNTLYSCINEERAKEGLKPVPWGDLPWAPFTLSQVGSKPPPSSPPAEEEEEEEEGKGVQTKRMTPGFWTPEKKLIAWKVFVHKSEAEEKKILGPMQAYFKSVEVDVLKRLKENAKRIEGTYAGWSRVKILAHLPTNKDARGINIDKGEEAAHLRKLVTPLLKSIIQDAGDDRMRSLQETTKLDFSFNVNDPAVLQWLGSRMREFSKEVAGTTFDEIEAILRAGFSEGQPVTTIAATLMEKFESWDKYRAPLIARTETIAGMNRADLEAVDQAGLTDKLNKSWLTAGDEAVRDTHVKAGMDYEEGIPIDAMFEVGQDRMDAPGNGKDAGENINCLLPGNKVKGSFFAGIESEYSGPAIEFVTKAGACFSVTPNHPILTMEGFVPACLLSHGDDVISYRGVINPEPPSPGIYKDYEPAMVEDVFKALSVLGSSRIVELTSDDLHGDAAGIIGKVNIVRADWILRLESWEKSAERSLAQELMGNSLVSCYGPSHSSFDGVAASFTGGPGGGTLPLDHLTILAEKFPFLSFGFRAATHLDSLLFQLSLQGHPAYARRLGKLLQRYSGQIFTDEIIKVRNYDFSGHVYDLQSESGLMIAGNGGKVNTCISNCRCTIYYTEKET